MLKKKLPVLSGMNITALLLAVAFIYFVYSFAGFFFISDKEALAQLETQINGEIKREMQFSLKPYSYYSDVLGSRQLFRSSGSQHTAKAGAKAGNAAFIKDLFLLGIVSSDNPQAIIEDRRLQRTYYVTKGQYVGEFKVEQVKEGSVMLSLKGEQFELHM